MRFFHKHAEGLNVQPIVQQLVRNPDLWNADRFRTTFHDTPFAEVDDILLRFSDTSKCLTDGPAMGDMTPIWLPPSKVLSTVKPLVLALMASVNAYELGRLIISRVRPGGKILAHADKDAEYVDTCDRARYHVVLQGLPGSLYHCAYETVCMRTGEVWWFNAHEVHSVENNSADDRIHLMVDVRIWD